MLTTADIAQALEQATRAPSVHNIQPWRWRIGPDTVDLRADWNRRRSTTPSPSSPSAAGRRPRRFVTGVDGPVRSLAAVVSTIRRAAQDI